MDDGAQAQSADRLQQEGPQLAGALVVAPIADPDQILLLAHRRLGAEQAQIGGLVPGPHAPAPALAQIDLAHCLAKGEHAVIAVQLEAPERLGLGQGAVVGVVEQEQIAAAGGAVRAQGSDQLGLVPFMDQDQIGAIQGPLQIELDAPVGLDRQLGKGGLRHLDRGLAGIFGLILPAPAVFRLEGPDLVAERLQLAHDAAQEMDVAVVPAGEQGVAEQDDAHQAVPAMVAGASAGWPRLR